MFIAFMVLNILSSLALIGWERGVLNQDEKSIRKYRGITVDSFGFIVFFLIVSAVTEGIGALLGGIIVSAVVTLVTRAIFIRFDNDERLSLFSLKIAR